MGQTIRQLANLAYPTASAEIRDTLSTVRFVDSLKQARPRNLNDAIQLAVELEAYNRAEQKNYGRSTTAEPLDGSSRRVSLLGELCAKLETLQRQMQELKAQWNGSSPQPRRRETNKKKLGNRRHAASFVKNLDTCAKIVEHIGRNGKLIIRLSPPLHTIEITVGRLRTSTQSHLTGVSKTGEHASIGAISIGMEALKWTT